MTDTTPTPNELLTRIAEASRAGRVEELRSIVSELPVPTPPPSQLRVIDLSKGTLTTDTPLTGRVRHSVEFEPGYLERLGEMPDPMTVITFAVLDWNTVHRTYATNEQVDKLLARIRTALEGATQ